MIMNPIKDLKDFVREYNQDIMLMRCMAEPLRPELEAFIKDNELGKLLRDKKIAELSGTLPKNDGNLGTWEKTILDEFYDLDVWIKNYTAYYGASAELELEQAIENVQNALKELGIKGNLEIEISPEKWEKAKEKCAEGNLKWKKEIAIKMLKKGFSIEDIVDVTGLSEKQVKELKNLQ